MPFRVYVVWEPILKTDGDPPGSLVLGRIGDARARQYWDPQHLVAKQMAADARPPQPKERCCVRDGILWDLIAIYPAGRRWDDRMPPATFFDGAVVDLKDAFAAALDAR